MLPSIGSAVHYCSTSTWLQVHEVDEAWDPDMLFAGVASELNKEKERSNPAAEGDKEGEAQAML